MVDEAIAELFGDALLERFELIVDELDDLAGLDVDQMVVMGFRNRFVAGAAVAELVAFEDPGFLEQANGPVDRRDRNIGVDRRSAGVKGFDVRMILAVTEYSRDDLALLGDAKALVGA